AAPAPPPAQAPAPAAPAPAGGDLSGATQYFQVPQMGSQSLVGVLACLEGPLKGQLFSVNDGDTRLGREGCEITLTSKRISRYHAKIVHVEGAFVIEANSEVAEMNPTLINDEPIDAEALSDGDLIRLGDCLFKFRTI
ncbi:MAG: FHA domain-containing protein, partial [Myxococcota bacterium]